MGLQNLPALNSTHFVDMLGSDGLRKCFRYWMRIKPDGGIPAKSSLLMSHIPPDIVPALFIYERTSEGRFRCRLAGTAIGREFGKDPTGLYLDELVVPSGLPKRVALFEGTLERQSPVLYGGRLADGEHGWKGFKRLLLPLADHLGQCVFVFGMVIFTAPGQGAFTDPDGPLLDVELWADQSDIASYDEGNVGTE